MKEAFTNLLKRQLRKHFGNLEVVPEEFMPFLRAINDSYLHYENDRKLMDRASELSSQELLENNLELSRKNELLDAFVYRVSHDLKTPINNLLSLSLMLNELESDRVAENPMLQRVVTNISDTAERMNTRINDLLDLSKLDRAMDAEKEEIDLGEMVQSVLKDLEHEMQKSEATLHIDFEAVPKLSFGRENLNSLLSNLLSNSIKYRSKDRLPVIYLRCFLENGHPVLSISDNGMGIDLEKHGAKLFGMFNRFHNHVAGTGVGLFIIKKIIEKSGGKIHVQSTLGQGTTFIIEFTNARSQEKTQLHLTR